MMIKNKAHNSLKKYENSVSTLEINIENKKNIPPSYIWGRWFFLVLVFVEIFGFIFHFSVEKYSISHDIFMSSILLVFDSIALIGLMKFSARLIEIYTSFLYFFFFWLGSELLIFLISIVKQGMPQLYVFNKFAFISIFLLVIAVVKISIFFNKKSRDWLKLNRILTGVIISSK